MDNKFIVIVPVYNADKYIENCLSSILDQKHKNREICVIDDFSNDNTWTVINDVNNGYGHQLNMARNNYRIASPLANIVKGIELFALADEDIIVKVDGDDSLRGTDVLDLLNKVYQDPDVYMTYGQFVPLSGKYGAYCKPIENTQTHRKEHKWNASHLITFKKKLFKQIKDDDLRDANGDYYKFIGDAALVYPMVEMCGNRHMRFIDRIVYYYNDLNPLNEMTVNEKEQLRLSDEIWEKPCYSEINKL